MRTPRPGAGEGLAVNQILRKAEFQAGKAHLILEQKAERFNDLLEIYIIRQPSHVMVGFDHSGFA